MGLHEMNLKSLGIFAGTDKASHSYHGETYLDIYERHFQSMRNEKIRLLEIGVRDGDSLRMWRDYFPQGDIVGVDINPDCKKHEDERIRIHICGQDAIPNLGEFNIIIDDGSHINKLTIASFSLLWRYVNPKGFYIIEDLASSYDYLLSQSIQHGSWPGMERNEIAVSNNRCDMDSLFLSMIRDLDFKARDFRSLSFYSQLAIIQKI